MTEEKTNPLVCACRNVLMRLLPYITRVDHFHLSEQPKEILYASEVYAALAQPCHMPPPWDAMIDDGERMRLLYLATLAERDEARADLAELRETYTDENGTVWTRPTAWAYMQVCKVMHAAKAANRAEFDGHKLTIQDHRREVAALRADLAEALVALKPFGKWQEVSADLKAQTREVMPYAGSVFDRAAAVLAKHQTEGKDA